MKKIKILTLFIALALFLITPAPLTQIKKTDLIAQVVIWGYDSEEYILQVTDEGALFAFCGITDSLKWGRSDDLEGWFKDGVEVEKRRLRHTEYKKVKEMIVNLKNSAYTDCSCLVELSPELSIYIDDIVYCFAYEKCLCWRSEEALRLAYNLVLMSPVKSGSEGFNELIEIADEALNGYVNQFGKKIPPKL